MSAWSSIGLRRAILFVLISYSVAYAAEWSSTRVGIPFGAYAYTEDTRGEELFLANVPVMDTLSFTFLSYVSYTLALFFGRRDRREMPWIREEALDRRTSVQALLLGTIFFVLIDVVIDPLAVRGDRWFLGKIFGYRYPGVYFGVPISNFAGWGVVGAVTIFLYQRADQWLGASEGKNPSFPRGDVRDFLGPGLYLCVLLFNLSVTFWIGEPLLGLAGVLIFSPVAVFSLRRCLSNHLKMLL